MSATDQSRNDDLVFFLARTWCFGNYAGVKLGPQCPRSHPGIPAGEQVVMEVTDRDTGQGILFTGAGFTLPDHGFVPYQKAWAFEYNPVETHQRPGDDGRLMIRISGRSPVIVNAGVGLRLLLWALINLLRRNINAAPTH